MSSDRTECESQPGTAPRICTSCGRRVVSIDELGECLKCNRRGPSKPIGTLRHETRAVGRNQVCPCGSGKKFKRCCSS